jgi:hypothetical protein
MNKFTQFTVIAAVGGRAIISVINSSTGWAPAQPILITMGVCGKHSVPADRTYPPNDRMESTQTLRAYWQPRHVQQRQATNAAIRWEKYREQAFRRATDPACSNGGPRVPRNNRMPVSFDGCFARPDSVLATAEDCLLDRPRSNRGQSLLVLSSIAGTYIARQRSA